MLADFYFLSLCFKSPVPLGCGGVALRLQSAAPLGARRMKPFFKGVLPPLHPPRHGPSVTAAPRYIIFKNVGKVSLKDANQVATLVKANLKDVNEAATFEM